jgi:hypothetical protein
MTSYCTLYDVKKRLQMEVNDVSSHPELTDVIAEAQVIMDEDLKGYVTTPLASVPDLLKYACADLAASIFKGRRAKAEAHGEDMAVLFRKAYEEKITKYLGNLSSTSASPLFIGEDDDSTE